MKIDFLDNLSFDNKKYFWQLKLLYDLEDGLQHLYQLVEGYEEEEFERFTRQMIRKKKNSGTFVNLIQQDLKLFYMSNHLVNNSLLKNVFHWYAVTVVNYTQVVGWIVHEGDESKAKQYSSKIVPVITAWRNKRAAHIASCFPREGDNQMDKIASTNITLGLEVNERAIYSDPGLQMTSDNSGIPIPLNSLQWCVSKEHIALRSRYKWERYKIKLTINE